MRIKINLMQMTPKRSAAIYWLHIDSTYILLIRQLKEKIQKVLKESKDIELYLDNVPFLDEDDIHVINENEEIIIKVKNENNCTAPININAETNISNGRIIPNDTSSFENLDLMPVLYNEIPSSPLPAKKRTRKRTHSKNKNKVQPVVDVENNLLDFQHDTSVVPFKEPIRIHKRFKLLEDENKQGETVSESSSDSFQVTREVFSNNSSSLKPKITRNTVQMQKIGSSFKSPNVPVFIRGKICTAENSTPNDSCTENNNNKSITSTDEDCDLLVVDWKNMCPVKLSNISEVLVHDLIQFKTLSMNERGEPEMSSVITARVNNICYEVSNLTIRILSGIREFMKLQLLSNQDDEATETEFVVQYDDLFEIFKLV